MKRELRNKIINYYNIWVDEHCLGVAAPCGHLCNLNKLCVKLNNNIQCLEISKDGSCRGKIFNKLPQEKKLEFFNMVSQAYLKDLIETKNKEIIEKITRRVSPKESKR